DVGGRRLPNPSSHLPPDFLEEHAFASLLVLSFVSGREWTGRIFIVSPKGGPCGETHLRFLQSLARRTGPAIENVYLLTRLRTRAGALERARVARELHDGVIQSLIGLEMQVDVLRRQAIEKGSHTAGGLNHVQALLRYEIISLRELMEQMRPLDVGPAELLEHLA